MNMDAFNVAYTSNKDPEEESCTLAASCSLEGNNTLCKESVRTTIRRGIVGFGVRLTRARPGVLGW